MLAGLQVRSDGSLCERLHSHTTPRLLFGSVPKRVSVLPVNSRDRPLGPHEGNRRMTVRSRVSDETGLRWCPVISTGLDCSFKTRLIFTKSTIPAQERRFSARGKRYSIPSASMVKPFTSNGVGAAFAGMRNQCGVRCTPPRAIAQNRGYQRLWGAQSHMR
jgi:hypothetical protein